MLSPEEIIKSQESDAEYNEINQVFNLYDGCVKEFDDEVGKIIKYLENTGLIENTIIVLYSDHGTSSERYVSPLK